MPVAKSAAARAGRLSVRRLATQLRGGDPLRLVTLSTISLTVIVAAVSIWWLYTLNRDNAKRELTNLSLVISEHVNRAMKTVELVLQQSSDRMRSRDTAFPTDRLDLHLAIQDMARSLAFVRTIAIFDADGNATVTSREYRVTSHNIADREYFQKLKSGEVKDIYVSLPTQSATTGERAILVSRPIKNPDGSFGGIVRIGLETDYFEHFFASIDIGPDTAVTLIRGDGILLLRSPPNPAIIGQNLADTPVFKQLLVDNAFGLTWHESPVDHLWRYVAARRLPDFPMVVILSVSGSSVMANWREQAIIIALGAAVTIVFLLWLSRIATKQLQQRERRTRQALEAANEASRAKSSFLGVMSHELRTPLNAIIGFSDVISRETFGPIANQKYLDYVNDINQSGRNLLGLINQILDLSRIEAGKHEMRIEGITLAEVWQPIANEMAAAAAAKNIHLSLRSAGSDLVFAGESRAMMQIISNLVSNAVKFTPEGGEITVWAEEDPATHGVLVAVADTGRGIPADRLVDVLQPFVQISDSYSRETGGVGLGLSICKSLAEAMGGRLSIASQVGKGTTVQINLRRWVERP
ncbi:ATP-binding protein [Dongia sp.]|uniref:sensor histidine kinase n=1 Tax=Dongia sp. TaxID=1977262 RepID=UPI0035AFB3F8